MLRSGMVKPTNGGCLVRIIVAGNGYGLHFIDCGRVCLCVKEYPLTTGRMLNQGEAYKRERE